MNSLGGLIYYSDSIFTNIELPQECLTNDLGMMKDELHGAWIDEAYFFNNKKYCYIYKNNNGDSILRSVISALSKDSIDPDDLSNLLVGQEVVKTEDRPEALSAFTRNMSDLSITILNQTKTTVNPGFTFSYIHA